MNKAQLVNAIAKESSFTKEETAKVLNKFLDVVSSTLKNGESITLVGFGTLSVKERAERKGRNPKTGEEITIPKRKVASCKLSKTILN